MKSLTLIRPGRKGSALAAEVCNLANGFTEALRLLCR